MEVEAQDADVVGYESIMKDGKAVGYVTSGAYGHCVERSLAAGYVPAALARDGERFEIDILGDCVRRPCACSRSTTLKAGDCGGEGPSGRRSAFDVHRVALAQFVHVPVDGCIDQCDQEVVLDLLAHGVERQEN